MPACSAQRSHSHSKVMDIFRTLGSGSLPVTAMLDFSGKANTSIHVLEKDDTATVWPDISNITKLQLVFNQFD